MHICLALYWVLNHFVSSQRNTGLPRVGKLTRLAFTEGMLWTKNTTSVAYMRTASCQRFKRILLAIIDEVEECKCFATSWFVLVLGGYVASYHTTAMWMTLVEGKVMSLMPLSSGQYMLTADLTTCWSRGVTLTCQALRMNFDSPLCMSLTLPYCDYTRRKQHLLAPYAPGEVHVISWSVFL
jgi:hypothetical protein